MKTLLKILLLGCLVVKLPAAVYQTITFGSIPGDLVDSAGNALTSSFSAELGTFDSSFTPTGENYADWGNYWRTFALSSPIGTDPSANIQLGADINDDGTSTGTGADTYDFRGKTIWLWVYNGSNLEDTGTEWFLGTASSYTDPETSETWNFPDFLTEECCPGLAPLDLALSQFSTETPVWGNQGGILGAGEYTFEGDFGQFELQTFLIPEPGSWFLAGLAFGTAWIFVRLRRKGGR